MPSTPSSVDLAVIGGGNMGAALVSGLLASGRAPSSLAIVEVSAERRAELATMFPGITIAADVPPCHAAVIAVKPYDVGTACGDAARAGATRLLSIAAGVTIDALQDAAPGVAVVRAMPNTPALVGRGASAVAGGSSATADDVDWAEDVLAAVGVVVRVPEAHLDAITGLAGSGPAYLFLVAESLIDAGVLNGLTRPVAEQLVTQLLVGSAALLADRGDAAGLRAMVTSPGGTTAAGLRELEDRGVRAAMLAAVSAATSRSRELGGR
jgi:pyrroline-5-carboxylate reductase